MWDKFSFSVYKNPRKIQTWNEIYHFFTRLIGLSIIHRSTNICPEERRWRKIYIALKTHLECSKCSSIVLFSASLEKTRRLLVEYGGSRSAWWHWRGRRMRKTSSLSWLRLEFGGWTFVTAPPFCMTLVWRGHSLGFGYYDSTSTCHARWEWRLVSDAEKVRAKRILIESE